MISSVKKQVMPILISAAVLRDSSKKAILRYGRTAFMDLPIGLVFEIMLFSQFVLS